MSDVNVVVSPTPVVTVTVYQGIPGTPGGTETALSIGAIAAGVAVKATPIDADSVVAVDSAAGNVLKRFTWAGVKATLKAYFDTLYNNFTYDHPASHPPAIIAQDANNRFVTDTEKAAYANLDSLALTGVPTAPTAAAGNNTTQLATTAFVKALGDTKAAVAGSSTQAFAASDLTAVNIAAVSLTTAKPAGGASVGNIGDSPYQAAVNSAVHTINFASAAKIFIVELGTGDGALCYTNYLSDTVTILGGTSGKIVNSASPTANQLGVAKFADSHNIIITHGSSAVTSYVGWGICAIGSSVS